MAQYRRSEIVSGAFIVLSVVAFGLFAFGLGGKSFLNLFAGEKREFIALMSDIQTLQVEAKVAIGGRRVGRVTKIEIATPETIGAFHAGFEKWWGLGWDAYAKAYEGDQGRPLFPENAPPRVLVTFEVDKEEASSLSVDGKVARALLMQEGFLGPHYIQVHAGPRDRQASARMIFSDKDIDDDSTLPLVGLETGLMAMMAELKPQIDEMMRKLNTQLLSDENTRLFNEILVELERLLENGNGFIDNSLKPLLDPDPARQDSLHALILRPTNRLIVDANGMLGRLESELRAKIFDKVGPLLDKGQQTLDVAMDTMNTVKREIEVASPKLQRVLANLEEGTKDLDQRLDALQKQVELVTSEAVTLLGNTNGVVADLRPELMESMQSLRRLMWEAELAMRKIRANPSVVLFGDDEKVLSTWPTDPAARRRTGRAPPYQQRSENDEGK